MIVINMKGGIGNQMFQYALYKALSLKGKKVRLDYYGLGQEMSRINRNTIFDSFVLDKEYNLPNHNPESLSCRISRKLKKIVYGAYYEKEEGAFDKQVFNLNKGYLDGYWQTSLYFYDIREELIKDFTLKNDLSIENKKILSQIKNDPNPVSIHIRLGDYKTQENQVLFGDICTLDYYKKAILFIERRINNATYYVFSNEPERIRNLLPSINYKIININDEKTGWADMYLMSNCKHNIVANSSFSWWGAWLNNYPEKIVVAPARWLNTKEMPQICPDEWIRI